MKVTISQKNLKLALSLVERIVGKNNSLPILSNILLKTESGRLKISATNLEIGINCLIGAKIDEVGEIAAPAKILAEFVSSLPDDKVTLVVKSNILSINSNKYKTQIFSVSASDFPIIPKINSTNKYPIPTPILRNALSSVIDSVAISETRPELSGIFIQFNGEKLICAATDSFRLTEVSIPFKTDLHSSFILPRNTALELIRVSAEIETEINIQITENQISFTTNDFELVSRLIEGSYPDYKKVIPEKIISKAVLDKESLDKNVKLAGLFSSNISDIKLICTEKRVEILSKNSHKGEIKIEDTSSTKGDPFDVSLNFHYLLDGLKIIKTNKVVLGFAGQGAPIALYAEDNQKDLVYLIMPLRS